MHAYIHTRIITEQNTLHTTIHNITSILRPCIHTVLTAHVAVELGSVEGMDEVVSLGGKVLMQRAGPLHGHLRKHSYNIFHYTHTTHTQTNIWHAYMCKYVYDIH